MRPQNLISTKFGMYAINKCYTMVCQKWSKIVKMADFKVRVRQYACNQKTNGEL